MKNGGIKVGILLAVMLLFGLVWINKDNIQNTIAVYNNKKLPIYCVKTDKKQVALSFDAAWGNC